MPETVEREPKLLIPRLESFYDVAIPLAWPIIRFAVGWNLLVHGWGKVTRGPSAYIRPFMTGLAQRVALRVLPYATGELERVLAAVSYYRRTVMRRGAIRGLDADLPQIAVLNVLVTHPRVPEAVVCEAVTAITKDSAELGRLNPLFAGLAELFEPLRSHGRAALEFGGVALHPGALRAYRELGLLT